MQSAKQRLNLNQRGVSLVEALVVSAVIASTVVLVVQFNSTFPVRNVSLNRSCEAYAQAIVNAVQEESYYRGVINFVPAGSARNASTFGSSMTASRAIDVATNWWSTTSPASADDYKISDVPASTATGIPLKNFQLINGSIRTLTSIYQTNQGVRCEFGIYPPLTSSSGSAKIAVPTDLQNAGGEAKIRLRPYNKTTGVDECGVNPLYIAPEEANPSGQLTSAFAPGSADYARPAGVEEFATGPSVPVPPSLGSAPIANRGWANAANRGMELSVLVTYTQDGQNQNCTVSQKFEYPRDRTPPAKPKIEVISNASNPRPNDCTIPGTTTVIRITSSDPETELGTQYLCRDLSWKKVWNPPTGPIYSDTVCISGGAVSTAIMSYPEDPTKQTFARQPYWVPCDKLQQCGITPTATYNKTNPNTDTDNHQINLTFSSLPFGCVMNAEVIAVDTAGNTSASDRSFLADSDPSAIQPMNEIHYPACGDNDPSTQNFCDPSMVNYTYYPQYYNFPNGYYTCSPNGCCVGPGCTPFTM